MNINVPYSWLKEYIDTNANPYDIANSLSLHSFCCEKIEKIGDDHVMNIEITSNRGDALSVLGIARELKAVLPRQGYKVDWVQKHHSRKENKVSKDKLSVEITDKNLVPRFSAVIIDNVKVGESPEWLKERLEKIGVRSLGNVIDITNYMMFDKGSPMHAFDYDKIKGHKMIVRESKKGEVITTLDDQERKLPDGVIVIEDGEGRLIDLCGIMGAKNSEVDETTKKILLFVQVYDPVRIRKASMTLGHRTDAALRFEKGIDYEGVLPALWESAGLIEELSGGSVSSELIDIQNSKYLPKSVELDYEKINQIAGVEISKKEIDDILQDLGFVIEGTRVIVPSWRYDDIEIVEDLAEEVIRLYGYYNLPNNLPSGQIPITKDENYELFYWEDRIKDFLKFNGFYETLTTSATSKELAGEGAIPLKNPFNQDFSYLKTSLLPQIIDVYNKNQNKKETLKLFEIGSVYLKNKNDIPNQPEMLGMVTNISYIKFKGILEALLEEIGVKVPYSFDIKELGDILTIEVPVRDLVEIASRNKSYDVLTSFNSIKEDFTLEIVGNIKYPDIVELIYKSDDRVNKVSFKGMYQSYLTVSIEYLDKTKQVSSKDSQEIRSKILNSLDTDLGIKIKS